MTQSISPKNIILYADDDMDDLQLVEDAFSNFATNVDVVTVSDGMKALNYLKALKPLQAKPCLIILDINMPRVNGKEVLQEIRRTQEYKDIPVVLFTTSSLEQDKEFALRHNAGLITKPLDVRQMEMITLEFIDHCAEDIRKLIRREVK